MLPRLARGHNRLQPCHLIRNSPESYARPRMLLAQVRVPLARGASVRNRGRRLPWVDDRGDPSGPRWTCDTPPIVLFSVLYDLLRLLIEILIVRGCGDAKLRTEVLALRHQLGVLERQVGRPRWQPADRLLLAAISRALPRPAWRSLLPSPETLLRWHRELVRRTWAAYRRRVG